MTPSKYFRGTLVTIGLVAVLTLAATSARGQSGCAGLPIHDVLRSALVGAVAAEGSGLNNQMWATIVDRDGVVCAVAFSGADRGAQWPGSRVISAQKANTANAFSLDGLALSTANLYSAVQPFGGSLYGLQHSNPVDTTAAYGTAADAPNYGQIGDVMVGKRVGGVNVFGGGLGLYIRAGSADKVVGGLGVSGDTSCADHMIAWRVRNALGLDHLKGVSGVSGDADRPDNIIYDITAGATAGDIGVSPSGFGHPTCLNTASPGTLPKVAP
jgi:uncharacterized protein GlcG (DUF336 family)